MTTGGITQITKCSVLDCKKPIKSRTYCTNHYRQFVFLPTHPSYSTWLNIIQRCHNPKHPLYKKYGGRGIVVCERWRRSYRNFMLDIGVRPSPRHSVGRINIEGNYEPSNCQWASPVQRSINRRMSLANDSGITGVYWHKARERFHVTITINKRRHHIGWFKTLPEAARARFLAEARYTV